MPSANKTRSLVMAALGDETRLSMISKLTNGKRQSISHLTAGSNR